MSKKKPSIRTLLARGKQNLRFADRNIRRAWRLVTEAEHNAQKSR